MWLGLDNGLDSLVPVHIGLVIQLLVVESVIKLVLMQ